MKISFSNNILMCSLNKWKFFCTTSFKFEFVVYKHSENCFISVSFFFQGSRNRTFNQCNSLKNDTDMSFWSSINTVISPLSDILGKAVLITNVVFIDTFKLIEKLKYKLIFTFKCYKFVIKKGDILNVQNHKPNL